MKAQVRQKALEATLMIYRQLTRLSLLLGNELTNEVESEYRLDCPKPIPLLGHSVRGGGYKPRAGDSMNPLNHSNNKTLTFKILSLCRISLLVSAVEQAGPDDSEGFERYQKM